MTGPLRRWVLAVPPLGVVLATLLAIPRVASAGSAPEDGPPYRRAAIVFVVSGVSFEQLLAVPEVEALARAGGAALLSNPEQFTFPIVPLVPAMLFQTPREDFELLDPAGAGGLSAVGATIKERTTSFPADDLLVLVVSREPSAAMVRAKDELFPLVIARGVPATLFPDQGPTRSLSSDSTRRVGVATGSDIQATIAGFLGAPAPDEGSVLQTVDEPAPLELHARYLAMRRMAVPIQTGAALSVTLAGLFGVSVLALRRRMRRRLLWVAAWIALAVPPLAVALFAAGHLSSLSYATVVPFVVAVTALGMLAFVPLRRRDVLLPPAAMGAAVLAFFAVEAAIGWTAALTLFLAGSELDGGRFYGLPNEFIGLLAGATLYVVARMPAWTGFAVIVGVALFAGLPGIGANLGGALTLFAAAGMWVSQRRFGRIGWKGLALTAVVVTAGMAFVLAAHVFWTASPTHATRFVQEQGRSLVGIFGTYRDRLLVGWRLIERNPFALVPVLGLPVVLFLVLRPPASVREAFEREPVWRDVVLVTVLTGIVAYVANDTGAAASGLAFALGLGGLMYVSLAVAAEKMEPT